MAGSLGRPVSARPFHQFSEVISEDFLSCRVCFKGLVKPRTLTCLHTFCLTCLPQHKMNITNVLTVVKCPVCNTQTKMVASNLETLPVNHLVERLSRQFVMDMAGGVSCDGCSLDDESSTATTRCINCMDYLCDNCTRAHRKTRMTRDHTIIDLDSLHQVMNENTTGQDEKTRLLQCSEHPDEEADIFDLTCGQKICKLCEESWEHDQHKTVPLQRAAQNAKKIMTKMLPDIEKLFPAVNKAISNVDMAQRTTQAHHLELCEEVKRHAESLRTTIAKLEDELLKQLDSLAGKNANALVKTEQEVKSQRATLVGAYQFTHQMIAHGNDQEIMSMKEVCIERLRQLSSWRLTENIHSTHVDLQKPQGIEGSLQVVMGKLVTSKKVPQPVLLEQLDVQLNLQSEWITGMAVNSVTGSVVIAVGSLKDGRSKVIITAKGKRDSSFQTSQLAGLALTREGNIVTVEKRECRVKMYTIYGQLIRSFKCLTPGGATIDKEGNILIAGNNAIYQYRRNGELLSSIDDKPTGRRHKLSLSKQLCVGANGDIIVSDVTDGSVRVYTWIGHLKYTYESTTHDQCFEGVTTDKNGNLLLADRENHRIHMVSDHGTFRSYVVTAEDSLSTPRFLAINKSGYLMVAEQSGLIKTYQYL